jgi:hypothetical protein
VTRDQAELLVVGGLTLVCVVLTLAVLRLRATAARTRTELGQLREQLEELGLRGIRSTAVSRPVAQPVQPAEFLITDLGSQASQPPTPVQLDGAAFADTVLRETVVKALSMAQGVRRGLGPATRNRIRFEMKQEVRRARKQRRTDLKAAQRDLHVRQRAALTEEAS